MSCDEWREHRVEKVESEQSTPKNNLKNERVKINILKKDSHSHFCAQVPVVIGNGKNKSGTKIRKV